MTIFAISQSHNLLYRFGELKMDYRSPAGYDRTRNTVIGHKDFDLTYLEESFTSEHWLVRVYRLAVWDEIFNFNKNNISIQS